MNATVYDLLHSYESLPVQERAFFLQMLPERKVVSADEELRAHWDLVYANAEERAATKRRLDGMSKVQTTLTTNEQRHHQSLSKGQAALSGDHEVLRDMQAKFVAMYEQDRKKDREDQDQFKGYLMDEVMKLNEKVERLTSLLTSIRDRHPYSG